MNNVAFIDIISWNRLVLDEPDLRFLVLLLSIFNPSLYEYAISE